MKEGPILLGPGMHDKKGVGHDLCWADPDDEEAVDVNKSVQS